MTTRTELTQTEQTPAGRLGRLIRTSLLAIFLSAAANLGLYYAAGILFPEVTAWPGAGPGQIVGAGFVYLGIGALVFALIDRFSSRPGRLFLIVATFGLLLSLWLPISAAFGYGPPGTPPASVPTAVTLSLMHLVSYAVSVPLFLRLASD